jgi:hypothetical protein
MPVAESSAATLEQRHSLVVFFHFAYILARLAVIYDSAAWYFDYFILAVLTERTTLAALSTISSHDMFLVLEVEERPEIPVAMQDYRPALTSVTTIRTAFRHVLGTMKVHTTCAALS